MKKGKNFDAVVGEDTEGDFLRGFFGVGFLLEEEVGGESVFA